jgi:hypothetical protein
MVNLLYYHNCETPTSVNIKSNSLNFKYLNITNELKPKKVLSIVNSDLSNLNYYNNIPISYEISENINYDLDYDNIYRYTGMYMPIFYSIELFKHTHLDSNKFIESNYKFDTSLSDFGIIKERKIKNVKGSV